MENEEEPNEIEIVTGDDSELDISTVYEHLNFDKVRNTPDRNNIIIPKVKKANNKKDDIQEDENEKKESD